MKFYEYIFQKYYFDESDILNKMPIHMRNEVHLYCCRILIEKTDAFRNLSKSAMGEIMEYFKQEIYIPHNVIIKCDDFIENIYFISFGTAMYMVTVVALEITELYKVAKSELLKLFLEYPDVKQKI
ncbi:unnamed protein product [Brassicogethes aeneus]|uniref:Cyclic nucleotide-binding domain-containing protein n=1 Tax=Brassicogethes aeneus TaxID=1431903 RepID=A0A9P0BK53_BRAAE|nr:unnamed protein product [Brassicogethes aeneus]